MKLKDETWLKKIAFFSAETRPVDLWYVLVLPFCLLMAYNDRNWTVMAGLLGVGAVLWMNRTIALNNKRMIGVSLDDEFKKLEEGKPVEMELPGGGKLHLSRRLWKTT